MEMDRQGVGCGIVVDFLDVRAVVSLAVVEFQLCHDCLHVFASVRIFIMGQAWVKGNLKCKNFGKIYFSGNIFGLENLEFIQCAHQPGRPSAAI